MLPLTWNADREQLGPNLFRARVGSRWRNYLSSNGWRKIDLTPRKVGKSYSIANTPYEIDVPRNARQWLSFQSTNRFDVWSKRSMLDEAVGVEKRYPTACPVLGFPTAAGILYKDAFPQLNADRLVQPRVSDVRDLVVFNAEPPGTGPVLVPLEIDFGTLPILKNNGCGGIEFNGDVEQLFPNGLSFSDGGKFRGVTIKQLRVWDSAGRSIKINLSGRVKGTRFVGAKEIPRLFFKNAVYPVYTDTTTSFYSDANPETTTVDGYVGRASSNLTWSDIHDGVGTGSGDIQTNLSVYVGSGTTSNRWNNLYRSALLFDASSIVDTDVVSAATLYLKPTGSITDGYSSSLCVVSSNPASNTAITTGDYNSFGSTRYATDDPLSNYSVGSYRGIALNSTGRAAVSLTGITKLGLRIDADADNTPPTWSASTSALISPYSADQAGTSDDPYLELTYTSSTFTASGGSFTLTGNSASVLYGRKMSTSPGAFTWTGTAATVSPTGRILAVTPASFAVSGKIAVLARTPYVRCLSAAFATTGSSITLTNGHVMATSYATFTVLGQDALFRWNVPFTAGKGTFTLTAKAVSFSKTNKLTVDVRSFTLEGKVVGTRKTYLLSASGAVFTWTGVAAPLSKGFTIAVDPASFVLTGIAATPKVGHKLAVSSRSYTLTGIAASPRVAHTITAAAAAFTQTANAATVTIGRKITAGSAAYAVTGGAAGLTATHKITASAAAFTLTGQAVTLRVAHNPLTAGASSFAWTATAAGIKATRKITASISAFTVTANAVGVNAQRKLTASGAVFTETANAITIQSGRALTAGRASFVVTGKAIGMAPAGRAVTALRGELSATFRVHGRLEVGQ